MSNQTPTLATQSTLPNLADCIGDAALNVNALANRLRQANDALFGSRPVAVGGIAPKSGQVDNAVNVRAALEEARSDLMAAGRLLEEEVQRLEAGVIPVNAAPETYSGGRQTTGGMGSVGSYEQKWAG